jgi:integrase
MALKFHSLTRPAIRAMKPGDRINEHGISADKAANGDVRYSINVMVDGQRVHRVVGRESDGVTREQAERYIEKVRTQAREGRLDLPRGRKIHRTFAEAADEYLIRLDDTGGKDMANKRRHLRRHLVPYFGKQRLDQLKHFGLLQYRKYRAGHGASEATVNRELATLLHLLNRAASPDWKWIKPEDKPPIPRVKEARKQIRILSDSQADALLRAAAADQDRHVWLFAMFGLNAAMRHSEILRVRFDEIDFDHCRIWINKAKAGEREQPITPSLRDALLHQREMGDDREGWIFGSRDARSKNPHRSNLSKQFLRVVIRARLDPDKVTPHVMRHTAITRLVKAGTDLPTIQKISGHKTMAMVLHYTHVHGVHIDNAIGVLDTGFSGAVTPNLHTAGEDGHNGGPDVVSLTAGKTAA